MAIFSHYFYTSLAVEIISFLKSKDQHHGMASFVEIKLKIRYESNLGGEGKGVEYSDVCFVSIILPQHVPRLTFSCLLHQKCLPQY